MDSGLSEADVSTITAVLKKIRPWKLLFCMVLVRWEHSEEDRISISL